MTLSQIQTANPQGRMSMVSGTNQIVFDNGVVLTSASSRLNDKLWRKLEALGYQAHGNDNQSDEVEGLVQASLNGENPFQCTVMCANPSLNKF
jgi:hypothetical protein